VSLSAEIFTLSHHARLPAEHPPTARSFPFYGNDRGKYREEIIALSDLLSVLLMLCLVRLGWWLLLRFAFWVITACNYAAVSLTFSQILRFLRKVTRRKPLGMRLAGAKAFAANPDEMSALCRKLRRLDDLRNRLSAKHSKLLRRSGSARKSQPSHRHFG
jgi:hypothetical protein